MIRNAKQMSAFNPNPNNDHFEDEHEHPYEIPITNCNGVDTLAQICGICLHCKRIKNQLKQICNFARLLCRKLLHFCANVTTP